MIPEEYGRVLKGCCGNIWMEYFFFSLTVMLQLQGTYKLLVFCTVHVFHIFIQKSLKANESICKMIKLESICICSFVELYFHFRLMLGLKWNTYSRFQTEGCPVSLVWNSIYVILISGHLPLCIILALLLAFLKWNSIEIDFEREVSLNH